MSIINAKKDSLKHLVRNKDRSFKSFSKKEKISAWIELTKPRITLLLTIIGVLSYFVAINARNTPANFIDLLKIIVIILSLSFGIFPLNHFMEKDKDALMKRTEDRPIPSGSIRASHALSFGLIWLVVSLILSALFSDARMVVICGLVAIFYLALYTPLKYKTAWHTTIGAFPGAAPPLIGWLVATGNLDIGAWALFGILFFWQFPHFTSIDMIYKDDYAKAQIRVLPIVDKKGYLLALQVVGSLVALLLVSLSPILVLQKTWIYATIAVLLGLFFSFFGILAIVSKKKMHAKYLLRASILYLPLIYLALIICP